MQPFSVSHVLLHISATVKLVSVLHNHISIYCCLTGCWCHSDTEHPPQKQCHLVSLTQSGRNTVQCLICECCVSTMKLLHKFKTHFQAVELLNTGHVVILIYYAYTLRYTVKYLLLIYGVTKQLIKKPSAPGEVVEFEAKINDHYKL